MVKGLELYDVTHSTMHARWRSAEGASGYMLVYAPMSSETADETEVKKNQHDMYGMFGYHIAKFYGFAFVRGKGCIVTDNNIRYGSDIY